MMKTDHLNRRCPRLGSEVGFSYCRSCGREDQPCFKVLDCWWEIFDVVAYFKDRLSPEAFARLTQARPPDKMSSLLDLVRQAQARLGK